MPGDLAATQAVQADHSEVVFVAADLLSGLLCRKGASAMLAELL